MRLLLLSLLFVGSCAWATACDGRFQSSAIDVAPQNGNIVLIPVFSDVHGRVETLLKSVSNLQNKMNTVFPVVLITGDLGTEDARFNTYLQNPTVYERYYEQAREPLRLNTKFYFVRGNHEDQAWLKQLADSKHAIVPVDPWSTFNYLADGNTIKLHSANGRDLRVAVLGGIHPDSRPGSVERDQLIAFDQEALTRLLGTEHVDLLLTHQGPDGTIGGHPDIRALVEVLSPRLHLHGHADRSEGPIQIGRSVSQCVPKLFSPFDPNRTDDFVILAWDTDTNEISLVPE